MNDVIIDIRHLTKSFGDKVVLDDINLQIREGEFVTLLGPSGCGKTTLLRQIAGFDTPTSGQILLEGKDLSKIPPHKRPLNTVFQKYALFPHLDVYDNIAFGLKLSGLSRTEIDKRVRKMLKMVSMSDYEDRYVDSLSGGQQQRVAIARALVNYPKVLLLDEPLAALDLKMRKDMQLELKELHRKMGITFIYVTHDQEEALTLSDTVAVVNEGRIQQIGTPTDIYNEPCNSFVADFIGESTILNGTMICDRKVEFMGHEFACVDEGFGENVPVDVVVRPEDVYIMNHTEGAQFSGVVKSCIFKGVHYEMFVNTDTGYELMVQDYNAFEPGSTVGLLIKPSDIQVMKKERIANVFDAVVTDESHVEFLGESWECTAASKFEAGEHVKAEVAFKKVELMDHQDEGNLDAEVYAMIYKGDHYHIDARVSRNVHIYVDTNDIWDKGDLVGVNIKAGDIKLRKADD